MKEEKLKGLSEEQIAKARSCKSEADLLSASKEEDAELSDEQLQSISGGFLPDEPGYICSKCKSKDIEKEQTDNEFVLEYQVTCKRCGHKWTFIP